MAKETVAVLIKKELGVQKFSTGKKKEAETEIKEATVEEKPEETKVEEKPEEKKEKIIFGNLSIDQCIKIAKTKQEDLLAKDLKKALKEVVGACVSMPITVEGKGAKEVLKDIDSGIYDSKL